MNLDFKFNSPIPEDFTADKEIFEEFILDEDENNVFGQLKEEIAKKEGLDVDSEQEEQEINEMVWQKIYAFFQVPFKKYYSQDNENDKI